MVTGNRPLVAVLSYAQLIEPSADNLESLESSGLVLKWFAATGSAADRHRSRTYPSGCVAYCGSGGRT